MGGNNLVEHTPNPQETFRHAIKCEE